MRDALLQIWKMKKPYNSFPHSRQNLNYFEYIEWVSWTEFLKVTLQTEFAKIPFSCCCYRQKVYFCDQRMWLSHMWMQPYLTYFLGSEQAPALCQCTGNLQKKGLATKSRKRGLGHSENSCRL